MQFKSSEVLILLAASVMSFIANLPDHILGNAVDRKVLLAGLTALVVVALFRYLQVLLLLTITILAIGANLPSELANALGISQMALLVALAALVSITVLNRITKVLPVEAAEGSSTDPEIIDGRDAMLEAIAKGDQATLIQLLALNESVNFTQGGTTPLHLAAEKGYPDIVRMLISHGADYRIKNAQGKTALEVALSKKKFIQTTEILHNASRNYIEYVAPSEGRRSDADIWVKQHDK
jgi:hypothetical protein